MWACPRCGRHFANRNQTHTCAELRELDEHFAGKPPHIREIVDRVIADPRFRRIESFSPRNHLHAFRMARVEEVDDQVADWLAEAYAVGAQRHLVQPQ